MQKVQNDFLFDEKHMKKIMRKAKFWSTVKIVGISMIVSPIIFLILLNNSGSDHHPTKV